MKYNREKHRRRSMRLKGYDYSSIGAYFVTICTGNRKSLFGEIIDSKIALSDAGKIALRCLKETPDYFDNVSLDEYIVMPNHIHVVLTIENTNDHRCCRGLINQTPTTIQTPINNRPITNNAWILMKNPDLTLGKIIRYFKAKSARHIRENGLNYFQWQRNYYDRVIRNETEMNHIRQYIIHNPAQWDMDEENPANIKDDGK